MLSLVVSYSSSHLPLNVYLILGWKSCGAIFQEYKGWHSCGKWCLASWGQIWCCLVLLNLPHTRLPFSWSFTANCFTKIPQYLQTTLQVYSFVITSTFLLSEGHQNTCHILQVCNYLSSVRITHNIVYGLTGSHKAALIISFDSHFICFYMKVDTHMFHSLGHHK
jgi:hypothetical protein